MSRLACFQLEALRLGYQQTTLKKVFEKLYRFVLPNKSTTLYSGDIDMVAGILKELLVHMKNFPQLVPKDDKISGLVKQSSVVLIIVHVSAYSSALFACLFIKFEKKTNERNLLQINDNNFD